MSETGWTKVPNTIARSSTLSSSARLVYIALASRADESGRCWPSRKTIASDSGTSPATVQRALDELRRAGLVSWEQTIGDGGFPCGSSTYTLRGVAQIEPGVAQSDLPPVSNRARGVAQIEPQKKTQLKKTQEQDDRFDEFWAVYPIRKGKKPAETAWTKALKKTDADAIIDGAKSYAEHVRRTGAQHVKWPQGWLNDERWTDEPDRPSLALVPGDSTPVIYDQWRLR